MDSDVILALITVPDQDTADRLANALVEKRLAACVNIIPDLKSVYRWQGDICRDDESLLLVKTVRSRFDELKAAVIELHPYKLPEIIAVDVVAGLEAYLAWVAEETLV